MGVVSGGGGGGGGSQPVTRQAFHDSVGVVIADGDGARLPFAVNDGPDALVDISIPTAPSIIEAGTYAIAIDGSPFVAMTDGGVWNLRLTLDINASVSLQVNGSGIAVAAFEYPEISLTGVWYCAAGAELRVEAANRDGAASRTFGLNGVFVQRLS